MIDRQAWRRRDLLAAAALGLAGLAGCSGDDPGSTDDEAADDDGTATNSDGAAGGETTNDDGEAVDDETPAGGTATGEADAGESSDDGTTETDAVDTPDLDLREANVTDVEFEAGDGGYEFGVTLYHDDDGEDGYADWWQVETLDGERLGRRDLAHAHSTEPFARSATIEIPDDATCVVVRGHDQTHEYGGQAMLVNLDTGDANAVRQGEEPESFDDADCP